MTTATLVLQPSRENMLFFYGWIQKIIKKGGKKKKSDTHHLNLSIFPDTVELDLLIGQRVVQCLLGGGLDVARFFCRASLWLGDKPQGQRIGQSDIAKDSSTHRKYGWGRDRHTNQQIPAYQRAVATSCEKKS